MFRIYLVSALLLFSSIANAQITRHTAWNAQRRFPDARAEVNRRLERSAHGWALRTNHVVVYSNRGDEDTFWAEERFTQTWADVASLASAWTQVPPQPNPNVHGVALYIDGRPPQHQDGFPSTVHGAIGNATMIYLNVSSNNLDLPEQEYRLRQATVLAFLQVTKMDQVLPLWLQQGLSEYVTEKRVSRPARYEELSEELPVFFGYNRRDRKQQWQRSWIETPADASALQTVTFLLEGHDARHAPEFLAVLREMVDDADLHRRGRTESFSMFSGRESRRVIRPDNETLTQLVRKHEDSLKSWELEPQSGQPIVETADQSNDEEIALQHNMAMIMKLALRFHQQPGGGIQPKIVGTDGVDHSEESQAGGGDSPYDRQRLFARLTDPRIGVWATLDADHQLRVNPKDEELRSMLGLDDYHLGTEYRDEKWFLTYKVPSGRVLEGFLAKNNDTPSRPIAKFTWR